MAINESRELLIDGTPAEILDVIADVESMPDWSGPHQSAEILDTTDDGRPRRVRMKVKTAGITEEMVVEYSWTDDSSTSTLVEAKQLKAQEATYTLTPEGDQTLVRFELTVDPAISLPGFVIKRAIKGGVDAATDGLRKRVHQLKKGR